VATSQYYRCRKLSNHCGQRPHDGQADLISPERGTFSPTARARKKPSTPCNRTAVIRAASLKHNESTGKLVYFKDRDKSPSINTTDRANLAAWIVGVVCHGAKDVGSRVVNVTAVKEQEME
jgi:hypothetical protein